MNSLFFDNKPIYSNSITKKRIISTMYSDYVEYKFVVAHGNV